LRQFETTAFTTVKKHVNGPFYDVAKGLLLQTPRKPPKTTRVAGYPTKLQCPLYRHFPYCERDNKAYNNMH